MTCYEAYRGFLVLLLLASPLWAKEDGNVPNWPQFRGPNASGVAEGEKPPFHFGPKTNLVWRIPVDKGKSSPCIWNNRIFLTTAAENHLETLCIDRISGEKIWSVKIPAQPVKRMYSHNNNPATPTPTTDGESVYVYFSSFGVVAYDFDGKELWRKPLPVPENINGSGTSPVLIAGKLILNCEDDGPNSCLLAINPVNGQTLWKADRLGLSSTYSTPIQLEYDGRIELLHASCLQLMALDPETGIRNWFCDGLEFICHVPTPVIGDGVIFVMSHSVGEGREPDFATFSSLYDQNRDGQLTQEEVPDSYKAAFFAFDENGDGFVTADDWQHDYELGLKSDYGIMGVKPGGSGNVTGTHIVWKQKEGVPQVSSPLYYQGRVYTVKSGQVTCFRARSGEILYEKQKLNAPGPYYASPIVANDILFFSSRRGTITTVATGDEFKILSQNHLNDHLDATPAIVDNKIYVRTDKHLWAFGEQ